MCALRTGSGEPVRFAVDRMLGRLARWLRVLGHDVLYGSHLTGPALAARARREGRLLVTRDTRLVRRRDLPPHLFITRDRFREQLREVAAAVPLGAPELLRRCLDCNLVLEEVPRQRARDRVPPFVLETAERFLACPRCRRLYWPATHRTRMLEELTALEISLSFRDAPHLPKLVVIDGCNTLAPPPRGGLQPGWTHAVGARLAHASFMASASCAANAA